MNLSNVPDTVWNQLAAHAILGATKRENVATFVDNFFYNHVYETWGQGKVAYEKNSKGQPDLGWSDLVTEWDDIAKSGSGKLGKALKDDSVGRASVQRDQGDTAKETRLWEKYNDRALGDRFQFVVDSGGGMVLFNRMRRGCQTYLIEKLARKADESVIYGWKVFGEAMGEGRSDSCVVYLTSAYTDVRVTEVVNNYIWPNIKDLVDPDFVPIGFYSIDNKPLWAMRLPDKARERQVLGNESGGSAGGLMGLILGRAFEKAAPTEKSAIGSLVLSAKAHAQTLVTELYG